MALQHWPLHNPWYLKGDWGVDGAGEDGERQPARHAQERRYSESMYAPTEKLYMFYKKL